jgi:hypothetical protein
MERYPNIIILLNLPQHYIPKAEFVLRTFCYILRLNPKFVYGSGHEGVHLYYGPYSAIDCPIKIHYDGYSSEFFERRELYPLEKVNFCLYHKEYIPFLFSLNGAIFSFKPESVMIRKDIVASAFYFLTCWHEYILGQRGERRGRVDFRQSLQYRWDFTDVPVVDVYCQMLLFAMGIQLPQFIREINWNQTKRFSISISHDIDYWDYWAAGQKMETFKYNLRTFHKRPLNAAYKMIGHALHKNLIHNPQHLIRNILRHEHKRGVRSTWFIFGKDDYEDARQNYIADASSREQLQSLLADQDVGLHGSPESAFDAQILKKEMDCLVSLGFRISGYRSHYLHFDYQKSFAILEDSGILYDSTLGYWENIGFRAGISFPFYPFNIAQNRPFRVLEIPLIVMDTTLLSGKAMNLSPRSAGLALRRLINIAARYQSHLSLLWHNTTFDPIDYPLWGKVYWKTLRYAEKKNGWITSLQDIYEEQVTDSY